MAWLEFSEVTVKVKGAELLHRLSFSLEKNESFALIGPSGGGKSLLLKVLATLIPIQSGTYFFDGADMRKGGGKVRRQIGMSFQKGGLFDSLTVIENLLFPLLEMLGLKGEEARTRAVKILEEVGLPGTENLFIHEMSGGMQKRLGVARALLLSPSLLLCDDPTAGLDPVTSREIVELLLDVKKRYGMSIILATSELPLASFCDRIGFIHAGEFLQIGSSEEVLSSEVPAIYQFTNGLQEGPLSPELR